MAFINEPSIVKYTAAAGQTVFQFGFKYFTNTDIIVYKIPEGEPGGDDKIIAPSEYTIKPVGQNIGGSITLNTGTTLNDTIVIQRLLPVKRTVEYSKRGDLLSFTLNDDQDYQTYLLQDFDSIKGNFLQVPPGSSITPIFPYPVGDAYIKWNIEATELENDTTIPDAVIRSENAASAAEASETAAAASAAEALVTLQDVKDQGDVEIAEITAEGTAQVARVIAEGDTQTLRAETEADRAETEADRATVQADEIKAIGVVSPVTSVPLLPNNETGVPTVTYDDITGLFTYGIPVGKTGEQAAGIVPQGGATVAELNALVADPTIGEAWWMEDSGTITYGSQSTVVAINEIVVWVGEGYFFNAGLLEAGTTWDVITDVTVEGFAPVNGDDLARFGTSYTKTEQDVIDAGQDYAIALNTAKVSYTDAAIVSQHTADIATNATDIADNAAAIAGLHNSPAGALMNFAGVTAPEGYLVCDGSEVAEATYPELFLAIGHAWATTGGVVAPVAGNFRLPPQDIGGLGLYMRGVGANGVGAYEADVFKEHSHLLNVGGSDISGGNDFTPSMGAIDFIKMAEENISIEGDPTETRPRSITTLLCIKAFDTISNPELIDITEIANQLNAVDARVGTGEGIATAWVKFEGTSAVDTDCVILGSYNINRVEHTATGVFVAHFETSMDTIEYSCRGSTTNSDGAITVTGMRGNTNPASQTLDNVTILAGDPNENATPLEDMDIVSFQAFGGKTITASGGTSQIINDLLARVEALEASH